MVLRFLYRYLMAVIFIGTYIFMFYGCVLQLVSPIFLSCTITVFLYSYLADLDPAFSKIHIYINSWSTSTRPSPTSRTFYFKFYTYFNSWVTSPPPFYYLLRVKNLQCSLYTTYYFNTAILYFYIRHQSPALYH